MICPSCGSENPEHALRCTKCSVPLVVSGGDDRTMDSPSTGSAGSRPSGGTQSQTYHNEKSVGTRTPSGTGQSASYNRSGSRSGVMQPGDELGPRFQIEGVLGEGGMGRVYKAYDRELERTVAIKVLLPELTSDPQIIQRFKHELLLASRISHKNILRIHDLSEVEGLKFITMAFVEGEDLNHLLKRERPFSVERSMKVARQLCEALQAAHAEGVVHRDFKPHNVLVGKNDHVYVSDFGLATSFETAKMGMTRSGAFVGTPRYMSPEQVEGGKVDQRSDLYSLGLVIYEMVTGDVPFAGESTWQVMYQRVKERPKDPRELKPDLPEWVGRIIMHCLEKVPANRYQQASEILADIDSHRSPSQSASPSQSRSLVIQLPGQEHHKWIFGGGALLFAGILFFAVPATRHLVFKPSAGSSTTGGGANGLPPLSKGKYLAVLPFRVAGDPKAIGYVADGLGESLSTKLFQLSDVHIASPGDAAKTSENTPLPQIAKDLGANMIVHGMVQGTDSQLRINVTLENMADNDVVWSKEFSGVSGDLLTIEDQIYAGLVDALKAKPTEGAMAASVAHPTENQTAYDLYLHGRNALRDQQDPKNIQTALDYFNRAIASDNNFALAYAGMADASLLMYREKKDSIWSQKAVAAAQNAERLNDKLPEVHYSLGSAYTATGQTAQAITELKKALELSPNSDEAYRRLGNAYLDIGQRDNAIQSLQKAVEINPYYWGNPNSLGRAYFNLGEYDKALKQYEIVTQLEPQNALGYDNIGATYSRMGEYDKSIPPFEKALSIQPYAATYSNLATSYFYLKRYPEAVQMFEKAVEMNPSDETFQGNLADAYRAAGKKDLANATYEKAIALAYKELQVNPRDSGTMGHLALYYAKKGDLAQAQDFVKKARAIDPNDVYLVYIAAVVDTIANDPAGAVKELRVALTKGFTTGDIEAEPEFAALQPRPEYQNLLKEFKAKNR